MASQYKNGRNASLLSDLSRCHVRTWSGYSRYDTGDCEKVRQLERGTRRVEVVAKRC
jgi:hypothetical protein